MAENKRVSNPRFGLCFHLSGEVVGVVGNPPIGPLNVIYLNL